MLLISSDLIEGFRLQKNAEIYFEELDGGDVYTLTSFNTHHPKIRTVRGILRLAECIEDLRLQNFPMDCKIVVALLPDSQVKAWRRKEDVLLPIEVHIISIKKDLFSRIRDLYETDALGQATVLVVGLGSGGSSIAVNLAKSGVRRFILMDHDRLAVENIARHACGIRDLGRFKTKAVKDLILDKNPFAEVETLERECSWDRLTELELLVQRSDLVFCCTDNRPSRQMLNLASVKHNRSCIYGGVFRRAYGGHVLKVIPRVSMCFQCFIDHLPEAAADQEITNDAQAARIGYSDRAVPVEPGLATDIEPIANMCVKLGILELLRGRKTTLASMWEDLSNPWFQWLNRREPGTDFQDLPPLDSGADALRILAWYGIDPGKNPSCPVCGDFAGDRKPSNELVDAFCPKPDEEDVALDFPPPP